MCNQKNSDRIDTGYEKERGVKDDPKGILYDQLWCTSCQWIWEYGTYWKW